MLLWPGQRFSAGSVKPQTVEGPEASSGPVATAADSVSRDAWEDAQPEGAGVDQDEDGDAFFEDDDNVEDDQLFDTCDDTPALVQPGLLIGSFLAEQNNDKLRKAGVTHVLQVAEGLTPSHPDDFSYMSVQVMDCPSEDLVAHFDRAFKFIDAAVEQRGACLVHCVAGVSRSSTICIGWLMWKHHINYDEAFRRVHKVRPWIMPNIGFRLQLRVFEEQGCDLVKWRAWRHHDQHGHVFEERPAAVVSLVGLVKPPGAVSAGRQGAGAAAPANVGLPSGSAAIAAAAAGGGAGSLLATFPRNEHHSQHVSSSTSVPDLGTCF